MVASSQSQTLEAQASQKLGSTALLRSANELILPSSQDRCFGQALHPLADSICAREVRPRCYSSHAPHACVHAQSSATSSSR